MIGKCKKCGHVETLHLASDVRPCGVEECSCLSYEQKPAADAVRDRAEQKPAMIGDPAEIAWYEVAANLVHNRASRERCFIKGYRKAEKIAAAELAQARAEIDRLKLTIATQQNEIDTMNGLYSCSYCKRPLPVRAYCSADCTTKAHRYSPAALEADAEGGTRE